MVHGLSSPSVQGPIFRQEQLPPFLEASQSVLFWRVFKSRKKIIYTVEMGTTVIYGWFWGFAKSLYCRGVLKGEDRDSETRVVD